MAVRIADGDSIAYWQTRDRVEFDGGPFYTGPHPLTINPNRGTKAKVPQCAGREAPFQRGLFDSGHCRTTTPRQEPPDPERVEAG